MRRVSQGRLRFSVAVAAGAMLALRAGTGTAAHAIGTGVDTDYSALVGNIAHQGRGGMPKTPIAVRLHRRAESFGAWPLSLGSSTPGNALTSIPHPRPVQAQYGERAQISAVKEC